MYILEKYLVEMGWSQAKLGRMMGVDPHTVGHWMRSERCPVSVLKYLELRIAIKNLTGD
jgi:hypothetical protein